MGQHIEFEGHIVLGYHFKETYTISLLYILTSSTC